MNSLETASAEHPDDTKIFFWLGRANELLWNDEEAIRWYSKAVESDPADGRLRFCLVRARLTAQFMMPYGAQGSKAAIFLDQLKDELRAGETQGLAAGELLLVEALIAYAIEFSSCAIERHPRYVLAYVQRGLALLCIGEFRKAEQDCTRVIGFRPDYAGAYVNRAVCRDELRDYRGALEDSSRAIELDPRCDPAWVNRASARGKLDDPQGEIEDATRAIELDPGDANAFLGRAVCRAEQGDNAGALEDLTESIRLNPRNPEAHAKRGEIRGKVGSHRDAIADLDEAIRLKPDYGETYALRGSAKGNLGEYAGAVADYERALDLAPPAWPHRKAIELYLGEARRRLGEKR